ncbi:MAG: glycosyltransferase family 2 protein [Patescibacteria group bacterium]|nr:glycosyltransferase family 2 protein [Patescibacteria group bacterium]
MSFPAEYNYTKIGSASDLENPKERRIYRLLEIFPAVLSWGTLIGVVLISWLTPIFAAVFIIAFDVYWLLKTIYLALHLRSAFGKMRKNMEIDWLEKLKTDSNLQTYPNLQTKNNTWNRIYHLILLPFYNEPEETIRASVESLANANYPKEKMIIVLAAEEKIGNSAVEIAEKIKKEYENKFFKFLITIHPADIQGEIPGKGSNIAWAGKKSKEEIIDALQIPYENVIVSAFDVDTVIYPDYFSRLTYVFLNTPNNQNFSYQPVPFYTNNIWQSPALARVVAFSATFWHTLQQERTERLTTFSSHSMPLQALINVDFWQPNMVSEDSRIFWQCLFRHNGNYGTIPLYYPVKMDANAAPNFLQTMKNLYKQQRRWAWGCENIPYMLFGFWKNKEIKFRKKWHYSWIYIEGFWSWSTNTLIIFMLGWLPIILGGEIFKQSLLAYNLPQITRWLMTLSMVGIITSIYLTMVILPPKPIEYGKHKYIAMVLQWPLLLITMVVFGAFPALEAQTRLALGKKFRLGFWVTPKGKI